jgi:hypothetical protein
MRTLASGSGKEQRQEAILYGSEAVLGKNPQRTYAVEGACRPDHYRRVRELDMLEVQQPIGFWRI